MSSSVTSVSRAAPCPFAPREVLRRAVAAWEDMGHTPKVGYEFEAYLMQPDGDGGWKSNRAPGSFVYGTGHFNDPTGVCRDIVAQAMACGYPLESVNAEYDESQFEFTLVYDDAMAASDEAFLFRTMAREVGRGAGLPAHVPAEAHRRAGRQRPAREPQLHRHLGGIRPRGSRRPGWPVGARQAVHCRPAGLPAADDGAVLPHGQLLQAPGSRTTLRLLAELGARPPLHDRAGESRTRVLHPPGEPPRRPGGPARTWRWRRS